MVRLAAGLLLLTSGEGSLRTAAWVGAGGTNKGGVMASSTEVVEVPYLEKLDMSSSALSYMADVAEKEGSGEAEASARELVEMEDGKSDRRVFMIRRRRTRSSSEDYRAKIAAAVAREYTSFSAPAPDAPEESAESAESYYLSLASETLPTAPTLNRIRSIKLRTQTPEYEERFGRVNASAHGYAASGSRVPEPRADYVTTRPATDSLENLRERSYSSRRVPPYAPPDSYGVEAYEPPQRDELDAAEPGSPPTPSFAAHDATIVAPALPGDYFADMAARMAEQKPPLEPPRRETPDFFAAMASQMSSAATALQAAAESARALAATAPSRAGEYFSTTSPDAFSSMAATVKSFLAQATANVRPGSSADDYLSGMRGAATPSSKSYSFASPEHANLAPAMPGDYFSSMQPPAARSDAAAASDRATTDIEPTAPSAPGPSRTSASAARSYGFASSEEAANVAPSMPGDYFSTMGKSPSSPAARTSRAASIPDHVSSTSAPRSYGFASSEEANVAPSMPGDYFSTMGTSSPAAPSPPAAPRAASIPDYVTKSSASAARSYGFAADEANVAPSMPGDYFSMMGTSSPGPMPPAAPKASTSDYLSSTSAARAYGFASDEANVAPSMPGDYFSTMGRSASVAPSSPAAPAAPATSDYLSSTRAARSYGFASDEGNVAPTMPGDYFSTMGASPSSPAAPPAASMRDYVSSTSAARSYGFASEEASVAPTMPGDYFSTMGTSSPGPIPPAAPIAQAASMPDYASSTSATRSYGFASEEANVAPTMPGDYFSTMGAAPRSPAMPSPPAPSTSDYLSSTSGSAARSYGFASDEGNVAPTMPGDYFSTMGASPSSPAAPPAASMRDYVSSTSAARSYGFASEEASVAPTMPGDYFSTMGTSSPGPIPPAAPIAQAASMPDYASSTSATRSYGFASEEANVAPTMPGDYFSTMGAAPRSPAMPSPPAPSTSDYLSSTSGSAARSYGFASDEGNVAPTMPGDYFSTMGSSASAASAASTGDYLSSMGGSATPSRSYGFADDANVAPAMPGDYFSNAEASTGDYLSSTKGSGSFAEAKEASESVPDASEVAPGYGDYLSSMAGSATPSKSYDFTAAYVDKSKAIRGEFVSAGLEGYLSSLSREKKRAQGRGQKDYLTSLDRSKKRMRLRRLLHLLSSVRKAQVASLTETMLKLTPPAPTGDAPTEAAPPVPAADAPPVPAREAPPAPAREAPPAPTGEEASSPTTAPVAPRPRRRKFFERARTAASKLVPGLARKRPVEAVATNVLVVDRPREIVSLESTNDDYVDYLHEDKPTTQVPYSPKPDYLGRLAAVPPSTPSYFYGDGEDNLAAFPKKKVPSDYLTSLRGGATALSSDERLSALRAWLDDRAVFRPVVAYLGVVGVAGLTAVSAFGFNLASILFSLAVFIDPQQHAKTLDDPLLPRTAA
eukprot:CAMPEP_0197410670 /NCGR_PEP_ID=MMETSP1165-20131217/31575_1 /TAXON_ID=284809 /ORGANISM="Chrysocystis fragilis, Strain CCMP3189" /LENGTH=1429 /DNA_ID=CAMNT_0042937175 /DNA_START=129 /DNA_END=4418 /DNA_ORIENTATION=+